MSEQAYTSIHYFTTTHQRREELTFGERVTIAWKEFKEDIVRGYQELLDNSADLVIRKLDL